ncbi:hypothetical protein B0H14DRAFT_3136688 [Mycena olivaceomarginata]|nr:hypothetical protein B0H14DRAFT_3136688 [Mycena olivaceomarginata]
MAILIGGDYAKGLHGCAEQTAHALAKRGLGDSLLLVTQTLSGDALVNFLKLWRNTLRAELISGKSGRRHPKIAQMLSETFPDPVVLHLYVHPLTSWSRDGAGVDGSSWIPRLPDMSAISQLSELLFSWGTSAELPTKLYHHVLPGLCVRRLAQHNELLFLQKHFNDEGQDDPPLSAFLDIHQFSHGFFRVEVTTYFLRTTIASALRGIRPDRQNKPGAQTTKIMVPIPPAILFHALPAMVKSYEQRTRKKDAAYRADPIFPPWRAGPSPENHPPSVVLVAWVPHTFAKDVLVPEIWQYLLAPLPQIRCLNLQETFLNHDLHSFIVVGNRMLLLGSEEGHDSQDEAHVKLPEWDFAIEVSSKYLVDQ